jgi:thiamine-monophosphate kinase
MQLIDAVHENRVLSRWASLLPRDPRQVGKIHQSDAELVPLGQGLLLALTVDTVVEEIRTGLYCSPFTAGRTAVISSLSDLAAVGADALGILLSVTLPARDLERTQREVAAGVGEACEAAGVSLLGGDTNQGSDLEITCVAAGTVPADSVLTRVGACAGQRVFASGPLGSGAALAAAALLRLSPNLFGEEDFRPPVRLDWGQALRGIASTCMDSSDGLIATLDQLARLNDMAIRVTPPLPRLLHPRAEALRQAAGLPAFPFLACLHGEFELVFTVAAERLPELYRIARAGGWEPLELGRTEPGQGLFIGEKPLDGARLRNLLQETDGDLDLYLHELLSVEVEP